MADSRASSSDGEACPIVGVIGGMGPDATVAFMQRVIEATPADDDSDHIHLLVDNNPKVPSRIKALIDGDGKNPGPTIAAMARRLEQGGASFLVMPCNTAHHYWRYAQEAVSIPVWNIVELTLNIIQDSVPGASVGMLASPALRKIGLYEGYANKQGIELLYMDEEEKLLDVIRAVKAGRGDDSLSLDAFNRSAHELEEKGADVLVLACTELSVIRNGLASPLPVVDSLQVLVDEVVKKCLPR